MLRNIHNKLNLIAILLLSFGITNAQKDSSMTLGQPWPLDYCINYAWQHNLTIKQSEISRDIAQNNVTSSKANVLPTVNGYVANTWNYGRTIDPFTNTFATSEVLSQDYYVSSQFTIFGGEQTLTR